MSNEHRSLYHILNNQTELELESNPFCYEISNKVIPYLYTTLVNWFNSLCTPKKLSFQVYIWGYYSFDINQNHWRWFKQQIVTASSGEYLFLVQKEDSINYLIVQDHLLHKTSHRLAVTSSQRVLTVTVSRSFLCLRNTIA